MRDLEQEKAEIVQIENCYQDYLKERKASITEQYVFFLSFILCRFADAADSTKVEALKAELLDSESQLKYL
jgi:hypothetical protein